MTKQKPWRNRYTQHKLPGVVCLGHVSGKPVFINLYEAPHLLILSEAQAPPIKPVIQNIVYQLSGQNVKTCLVGGGAKAYCCQGIERENMISLAGVGDFLDRLDQENTLRLQIGAALAERPRLAVVVPAFDSLSLPEQNLLLKIASLSKNTGVTFVIATPFSECSRPAAVIASYMPFAILFNESEALTYVYGEHTVNISSFDFKSMWKQRGNDLAKTRQRAESRTEAGQSRISRAAQS